MLDFKDALAELKVVKDKLVAEGHAEAAKIAEIFHALMGDAPKVEAEAKTDVAQVAHDAVAAEAPVVNEAMQDVAAVADTAASGVTTGPTKQ